MSKPITLYAATRGPNPAKVIIILEELGIPYETKVLDLEKDIKVKPYTDLNPNGRLPTIQDPNTGLTLWESGAIIEYLIDTYDVTHKISFATFPEKWLARQFLHFQMSGQGPYFGQFVWFHKFHPPPALPTAQARYANEVDRVTMVLDHCLAGKEWLVGGKCSFADLSFYSWYHTVFFFGEFLPDLNGKYANFAGWFERLGEREAAKRGVAPR